MARSDPKGAGAASMPSADALADAYAAHWVTLVRVATLLLRDQARAELQRLRDRLFGLEGAARDAQEKQRAAEARLAMLEETTGLGTVRQLLGELDPVRRAVLEKGIARLLHWGRRR